MLRLCASPCDLSLHSFSSSRLPSPAGYSEFLTWWLKVLRWSKQKLPGLRSPRMSLSPHSVSQRPDSKARTNYFLMGGTEFMFRKGWNCLGPSLEIATTTQMTWIIWLGLLLQLYFFLLCSLGSSHPGPSCCSLNMPFRLPPRTFALKMPIAWTILPPCNKMSSFLIFFMCQFKCHIFRETVSDPLDLNNC